MIARSISVQLDGLRALSDVSDVTPATPRRYITGLIGPIGAGKTTLVNAPTGFQPTLFRTLERNGETIDGIAVHKLRRNGVAGTFQSGRLFRDLPTLQAQQQPVARFVEADMGTAPGVSRCTAEVVGRNSTRVRPKLPGRPR